MNLKTMKPINLKLPDMLQKEMDLHVMGGYFGNRSEFIREAIREFLSKLEGNKIEIAVELYRKDKISLGKAAEISGLGYEKMKNLLAERSIPLRRGPSEADELNHDHETAKGLV